MLNTLNNQRGTLTKSSIQFIFISIFLNSILNEKNMKKIFTFLLLITSMFVNAQWSSLNGSFGFTDAFPAVAISGNSIFIATSNNGVYKSDDNGEHWFPFNNGLSTSYITNMKINGTNIYLANATGLYVADINIGIWTLKRIVPESVNPSPYLTAIEFNGNQIFVGSYIGLFTSNDIGQTWSQLGNNTNISSVLFDNNNLYIGNSSVSKSTDLGVTWTTISNGLPINSGYPNYHDFSYTSIYKNNGKLFIGAFENYSWQSSNGNVCTSVDEGQNWVVNSNNMGLINNFFKINNDLFLCGRYGLKKSINNGLVWTDVSIPTSSDLSNMKYSMSGSEIVLVSKGYNNINGNVFISNDSGLNWRKINGNLLGIPINSIQFLNSKIITSSSNYGNIYTSSFDGSDWNEGVSGKNITSTGTVIYKSEGATYNNSFNSIYSSIDGYNWTLKNNNQVYGEIIMMKAIGNTVYASTVSNRLFKSNDYGVTWTLISTISQINNILKDGNTLYITSGAVYNTNDIYKSIDNGVNWISIKPNNLSNFISSAVLKGSDLYIGTAHRTSNGAIDSQGVFKSIDGGTSWSFVNNGFETLCVDDIIQSNNILYTINEETNVSGNLRKMYMSADNGSSWQVISTSTLNGAIPQKLESNGNYLYCGTSNGLWRTSLSSLNSAVFSSASNSQIIIYPNPTNSKINIDCGSQSNLIGSQIKITNTLGQDIYNSILNRTVYEISLGSIATSGLYFVTIINNQGKLIATQKIILQ